MILLRALCRACDYGVTVGVGWSPVRLGEPSRRHWRGAGLRATLERTHAGLKAAPDRHPYHTGPSWVHARAAARDSGPHRPITFTPRPRLVKCRRMSGRARLVEARPPFPRRGAALSDLVCALRTGAGGLPRRRLPQQLAKTHGPRASCGLSASVHAAETNDEGSSERPGRSHPTGAQSCLTDNPGSWSLISRSSGSLVS